MGKNFYTLSVAEGGYGILIKAWKPNEIILRLLSFMHHIGKEFTCNILKTDRNSCLFESSYLISREDFLLFTKNNPKLSFGMSYLRSPNDQNDDQECLFGVWFAMDGNMSTSFGSCYDYIRPYEKSFYENGDYKNFWRIFDYIRKYIRNYFFLLYD